jgi:hypothetical protein
VNKPTQHHYLPQFYLRGFAGGTGGLWVYDIKRLMYRRSTPNTTAKQRHYYTLTDRDGKRDLFIEEALSGIETDAAAIIRDKLIPRLTLTPEDKCALSLYIAMQHYRTPDFEEQVEKSASLFFSRVSDMAWSTVEAAQASLDSLEVKNGSKPAVTAEEMHQAYKSGDFKLTICRNLSLQMMTEVAGSMTEEIALLEWAVLCAPPQKSFVTTDSPFLITPPQGWNNRFGPGTGLRIRGTRKWFPLTAERCLVMFEPGNVFTYRDVTPENVREINLEMAWHAYELVIARDEALLRSVVELTLAERRSRGSKWGGSKLVFL